MKDCIFCKIINGDVPSAKIFEDEHTLAFLDISKEGYGHTLVVPKVHAKNVLDIDEQNLCRVINTVKLVSNHYVFNCGFSGVNIMNASGEDAQQSVMHLHFHIVPRKEGDKMNTWPHIDKVEDSLTDICEKLKI